MSERFVIKGGKPLLGEIQLAGAKNAVSKEMVASLLTEEPCILENVPQIGEIGIIAELFANIGSNLKIAGSTARIATPLIKSSRVPQLSRRNRIPILALGPLLARTGEAEVPILGGDKIGPRPVDIHLEALAKMGVQMEITKTSYRAWAKNGLHGAEVELRFPSVGATENAILTAVLAEGKTVIRNAALEPELIDLIKMLQNMGAIIELAPPRTITIQGVTRLHGVTHRVMPDRNEAVSFACLAIATRGRILVKGARQDDLITFLNIVRRMGAEYEVTADGIAFFRPNSLAGISVQTDVHPGFMTDWQQPLCVLFTQARGESSIHETIYEDRFAYAHDLSEMGAHIRVSTDCPAGDECRFYEKGFYHYAVIEGPTPLKSARFTVRDLRSGMVDILAALVAEGVSEVEGVEEIDRGYEHIDERLRELGADIRRVS
ncbi:MAG TPA: UDP-N-acetylglucosamine 1-carboxyvinyltransferase [Candidatus Paceibacterota bacterium]|jgi:UDP-N-acetylglucosamine 1-carboxyvinyltransferase|nr:UDP-N-acetylglucosamine 1-carboxyvinyltransferase [Candidatus Paceibacterota bacterium]